MTQNSQTILKRKNEVEGVIISNFKLISDLQQLKQCGTGIKTDRSTEWNEEHKNKSTVKIHEVLTKEPKIQWETSSLFNKWCWENYISTWKSWTWTPISHQTQKLTKWMADLHVSTKPVKFSEENVSVNLHDV
jgi:hypothetical protein